MKGRKPNYSTVKPLSHHAKKQPGLQAPGIISKTAPKWLNLAEKAIYRAIIASSPGGLLKPADGPAVARLAVHRAAIESIHTKLETMNIEDPAAMTLRRLMKGESELVIRYETELGLIVTARARIVQPPAESPELSEFEKFQAKRKES